MRVVRSFSAELKEGLVRRMKAGELVRLVAAEMGVYPSSLYQRLEADRAMGPATSDRRE